jgi:hypothetical protein
MDSTTPTDSDIINECAATSAALLRQPNQPLGTQKSSTKLFPRVTHGFDSRNSPYGLRYHKRTAATGDASIQKHKATLGTQKSSKKLVPRLTHGFDSPNSP